MNSEQAQQSIQELESLRAATRRFNRLTIFALIVIVVSGVSVFINAIYSLASAGPKQTIFVHEMGVNLQQGVLPVAQKIAGESLRHLKPAVEKEIQGLNNRAPQVADAALREINGMSMQLAKDAESTLDRTVGAVVQRRENKLRQMYPGLYDKQAPILLDNMSLEIQDQLARTGDKIFNPHLNSIQRILTDLDKIQKTETIEPGQQVDAWQISYLFMDVFVNEFKDAPRPAAATPDTAKL